MLSLKKWGLFFASEKLFTVATLQSYKITHNNFKMLYFWNVKVSMADFLSMTSPKCLTT